MKNVVVGFGISTAGAALACVLVFIDYLKNPAALPVLIMTLGNFAANAFTLRWAWTCFRRENV